MIKIAWEIYVHKLGHFANNYVTSEKIWQMLNKIIRQSFIECAISVMMDRSAISGDRR